MNRQDNLTQIAHQFGDFLDADRRFSVWIDTDHFGRTQITQRSVIEEIIRSGIARAQIFVVIYFPDEELTGGLSDWLINEERKAINASMPVLEIYLHGARQKQFLNPNEVNYRKRYTLRYFEGQRWMDEAKQKLIEIAREYDLG